MVQDNVSERSPPGAQIPLHMFPASHHPVLTSDNETEITMKTLPRSGSVSAPLLPIATDTWASGQIVITAADVSAQLAPGITVTIRTDTSTKSINIGTPGSAKVNTVRVSQDRDYVFTHSEYDLFGPKTGFGIFCFENGKIAGQWDTIEEIPPGEKWKRHNGKF